MSAELKELLAKAYAEKESMTDANLGLTKELAFLKGQHQSAETKVRALQAVLPATTWHIDMFIVSSVVCPGHKLAVRSVIESLPP